MKNPAFNGGAELGTEILENSQSNNIPALLPTQVCYIEPTKRQAIYEALTVPQRLSRHLHELGELPVYTFLAEIGRAHGIEDDILRRLKAYARLDPKVLRALGGDKFPPSPLMVIDGRRR